jgi:methionine synthase / methylenetetrahydrofolate reductase(NADPH)
MTSPAEPTISADTRPNLLAAIEERVLIGDGATGTVLQERGVPIDACLEQVNLDKPSLVRQLHREYIDAGADLIQTNSFGANRVRLRGYGLEGKVAQVNRRAVEIANEAMALAGRRVFLAGDIGPIGPEVDEAAAREAFAEQMEALAAAGVDALLLQTFPTLVEALVAVSAATAVSPHLPLIAELTFDANEMTFDGHDARTAARALAAAGADVVGVNCGEGAAQALRVIRQMRKEPGLRLIAQPSAGRPQLVQRRVVYSATTEYMADYARRLVKAGAVIIGGCCGTSPRHIGAMRRAVFTEPNAPLSITPTARPSPDGKATPKTLRQKLAAGRFIVSVEIDPPRGLAVNRTLEAAALMKEAGADVVNVGDSPMAEVRMSAIAMASLLRERVGVEPIVHCSTRDRNLMALQADMMGAHALGLRNVLCIKGDPHALGSYTNAAAVWDVNALGLMRILKGFNAGHDAINNPVKPPTRFFVGAAVNPSAQDIDAEVRLVRRKVKAGADFLVSQAVFEVSVLERFLERLGTPHVPIILGVWPIHTLRQASFLNERVIPVPGWVREEMATAGDNGEERGIELAVSLLEKVRPLVQGVYFIPSFGRFTGIAQLVSAARDLAD